MDITPNMIGSLNEHSLHADLKAWYACPGDRFEVAVDGFVVDIVRGDTLVEIQTRNFSAIRRKLAGLVQHHNVRLVYPIAQKRWIVKLPREGEGQSVRRKSPKQGHFVDVFDELVSIPELMADPRFSIELLLIHEEEIRRFEASRRWRRKGWATAGRRLLAVTSRRILKTPADLAAFIPAGLEEPFATSDLAAALGKPLRLAQRMAYCLREIEALCLVGKRGNALLYRRAAVSPPYGAGLSESDEEFG